MSVLPFIDQAPLYNRYDFNRDYTDGTNSQVRLARLAAFKCPSDREYSGANLPGNNYAGSGGSSVNLWSNTSNGVFQARAATGIASCTDGTSNVILVSELLKGDGSQTGVSDSDIVNQGSAPTFVDANFPTSGELETAGVGCDASMEASRS